MRRQNSLRKIGKILGIIATVLLAIGLVIAILSIVLGDGAAVVAPNS